MREIPLLLTQAELRFLLDVLQDHLAADPSALARGGPALRSLMKKAGVALEAP